MNKVGEFICKNKLTLIILSLIFLVLSVIGYANTKINYDILVYLPDTIETMKGQDILKNDFDMGAFTIISVDNSSQKEIIDIEDKSTLTLVIGHSLNGIFKLNLSESLPHVLIGASTRAGKSRLIKSICLNVMENYTKEQVEIIYCDQKGGVEARAFKDCEHFIKISKNVNDTIKIFIELEKELDNRLNLFEERNVTNLIDYNKKYKKLPFIFVIVDELYPFLMMKNKKDIYSILADLLSRSASVGIHFLLSSQKTTSDVIPTFITENVGYRLGLRTSNEQGSYNVIGDKGCEDIPVDAKGRGICFVDEKIYFQSFYVDDDTINNICLKHKKQNNIVIESEDFGDEIYQINE